MTVAQKNNPILLLYFFIWAVGNVAIEETIDRIPELRLEKLNVLSFSRTKLLSIGELHIESSVITFLNPRFIR